MIPWLRARLARKLFLSYFLVIVAGHYAERVPLERSIADDELGQLAASFNEMAGALEHTERRRLAQVGDVEAPMRRVWAETGIASTGDPSLLASRRASVIVK